MTCCAIDDKQKRMSARRGAGGKAMLGRSVTQVSAERYENAKCEMRDARCGM
jgi:hypothetical protein